MKKISKRKLTSSKSTKSRRKLIILSVLLLIGVFLATNSFANLFGSPLQINQVDPDSFEGTQLTGGAKNKSTIQRLSELVKKVTTPTTDSQGTGLVKKTTTTQDPNKKRGEFEFGEESTGNATDKPAEKSDSDQLSNARQQTSSVQTGGQAGGELSPDNHYIKTEKSDSDQLSNARQQTDMAEWAQITAGASGTDAQGNKTKTTRIKQQANNGQTVFIDTTTVTSIDGNQTTTIKGTQFDGNGNFVSNRTVTVQRTRQPNGEYKTSVSVAGGGSIELTNAIAGYVSSNPLTTANNPRANIPAGGELSPDQHTPATPPTNPASGQNNSTDTTPTNIDDLGPTNVSCPTNTRKVSTSNGVQCVSLDSPKCDGGIYGYYNPTDKKCYWIGEEVSGGYEVCDWTVGGRPGVNWAFLSTNCPTKTNKTVSEPKNAVECAKDANPGWWSDNENKCVRVGERVTNSEYMVCSGGTKEAGYLTPYPYVSLPGDCPDTQRPANGILHNTGNEPTQTTNPETMPQDSTDVPLPPPVDGTEKQSDGKADKDNNGLDPKPKACYTDAPCGAGFTCEGELLFIPGKCQPNNTPNAYQPPNADKDPNLARRPAPKIASCGLLNLYQCGPGLSCEGATLFSSGQCQPTNKDQEILHPTVINPETGKVDEIVKKPEECLLDGAQPNADGTVTCPRSDGLVSSKTTSDQDSEFCLISATCDGENYICDRSASRIQDWKCVPNTTTPKSE